MIVETNVSKHALIVLAVEPTEHTETIVESHVDDALATVGLRALDDTRWIVLLLILVTEDIATAVEPNENSRFLGQHVVRSHEARYLPGCSGSLSSKISSDTKTSKNRQSSLIPSSAEMPPSTDIPLTP